MSGASSVLLRGDIIVLVCGVFVRYRLQLMPAKQQCMILLVENLVHRKPNSTALALSKKKKVQQQIFTCINVSYVYATV